MDRGRGLWGLMAAGGDGGGGGHGEGGEHSSGHGRRVATDIARVDALGTVIASLATAGAFSVWSKCHTISPPPFFPLSILQSHIS